MSLSTTNLARFELFTSLRLDPILCKSPQNSAFCNGRESPLYMLSHHQSRLLEAAEEFSFHCIERLDFLKDGAKFEKHLVLEAEAWRNKDIRNDSLSPLKVQRADVIRLLGGC